eukprot:374159-Hanusia_phi.AAC.1
MGPSGKRQRGEGSSSPAGLAVGPAAAGSAAPALCRRRCRPCNLYPRRPAPAVPCGQGAEARPVHDPPEVLREDGVVIVVHRVVVHLPDLGQAPGEPLEVAEVGAGHLPRRQGEADEVVDQQVCLVRRRTRFLPPGQAPHPVDAGRADEEAEGGVRLGVRDGVDDLPDKRCLLPAGL